jgi:CubicO group peptidase (beta-lactamase class C family)
VAQSRLAGEWHNIWLQVSEAPPYGVTSIGFLSVTRPAAANPRVKMGDSEIAEQLQTFLDKLVKADLFSGVVLVAKDGKPIYKKAYGLASMGFNVANRVDTKFNIGSMNKMFTAVAIMQLVEQGKLSLNEPIVKYLPDYPNNAVASKVTIHHLLSHTSGLGDYFGEKFEMVKAKLKRIQDYFPLFVDAPLLFELGQKFGYSNAGYVVLGAVIEKASGRDYFDYVREHVYKPARMVNSDSYEIDRDILDLAVGYTRNDLSGRPVLGGVRRNNLFVLPVKGSPAGGGYSTVDDLLSFDRALRQHKLLSSKSSDIIITGRVAMSADTKYAYGFTEHTANGKRIVGHNGFFSGYNSRLDMYLDDSYTVVVLSNYDFPIAERVANKVREMITQE